MRQAGSRGEATLYHVPTLLGPFALVYSSTHPTSSKIRPPHVESGHGNDIFFVFGSSFWGSKYEFSNFSDEYPEDDWAHCPTEETEALGEFQGHLVAQNFVLGLDAESFPVQTIFSVPTITLMVLSGLA